MNNHIPKYTLLKPESFSGENQPFITLINEMKIELHKLIVETEQLKNQKTTEKTTIRAEAESTTQWMTSEDVVRKYPICKRTLFNYRKDGKIPFKRFKAKIFYHSLEVEKAMESNKIRKRNELCKSS
ncbi:MAG: helix-turn-helix domain-containing protein [Bacteroidales bacterium]